MMLPFHKMHGAGNDFVVVDGRAGLRLTRAQVAALSDRHTGIGCDQFITLESSSSGADVFMRIQNPDGGEAGACGNATRCVADLLFRETGARQQTIRTAAGDLPSSLLADGRVAVDMGPPRFEWADIPLARAMDTLHLNLPGDPAALSMGNPHATFFVPDAEAWPAAQDGPLFEHDAMFPDRCNIGFAQILDPGRVRLRVWERGAGLTRSCGSGACAAAVNAHRRGLTGRTVEVVTDGGALEIEWREDGHVLMTGPVATSFTGQVDPGSFMAGAA